MLILCGICLQGLVASMLLRPVEHEMQKQPDIWTISKATSTNIAKPTVKAKTSIAKIEDTGVQTLSYSRKKNYEPNAVDIRSSYGDTESDAQRHQTNGVLAADGKASSVAQLKLRVGPYISLLREVPPLCSMLTLMVTFGILDTCVYTFLPALAIDHGSQKTDAALLITWAGIADTTCRILFGIIMDTDVVKPWRVHVYCCLAFLTSIVTALCPMCNTQILFIAGLLL